MLETKIEAKKEKNERYEKRRKETKKERKVGRKRERKEGRNREMLHMSYTFPKYMKTLPNGLQNSLSRLVFSRWKTTKDFLFARNSTI